MVANITPLPPAPVRGSTEATFSAAANLFVAALPTLVTEINIAGNDMETAVTAAQLAETNAETAETNAETAQTAAESARDLAYASSNFKGLWSSLVGALAKPASVAHNDLVWLLLNNLADVTASEPSTSNADWLIAAAPTTSVSLELTANSNGITAGNVVELVSTGGQNVQNIYHCEAPTISSLVTLDGTNDVAYLSASASTDTSAFLSYKVGTSLYCATIDLGNPPTQTRKSSASTGSSTFGSVICALTSNTGALINAVTGNGKVSLFSFSGTNAITFSSAADLGGITEAEGSAICALTSSNWFVTYVNGSGDGQIRVATSNGTNAPALGIATGFDVTATNGVGYLSLARLTDTEAMLVFQDSTANRAYALRYNSGLSGTAHLSLDGTNNCTFITQSPIDSNHTLCAYNNATTSNGCLAVIQANGTNASTIISRSVFALSAVTYCSLTSHSSTSHSLLFTDSNSDGQHLSINVDSNYSLTWSQQSTLNGTTNCAYNAVAALTTTTAIGAWQEGAGSDGKAATLTLTPTPVISGQLVGLASTSATNGATASVDVGPLVTGTYTSGLDYYVAGAGGLTTTATPVHVGKAKSTTQLVLDLRGAPEAGKQQVWEITTLGAFTFTVPEDGEYEIELIGGGASGSHKSDGNSDGAVGGGAGATCIKSVRLAASNQLSGTVGSGGAAQTAGLNNPGFAGTSTTITLTNGSVLTAGGGSAPGGISGTAPVGPIADGGQATGGDVNIPGGNGIGWAVLSTAVGGSSTRGKGGKYISYGSSTARTGYGSGGRGKSGTDTEKGGDGVVRITLVHGSGK